jgi:hypothetical protein
MKAGGDASILAFLMGFDEFLVNQKAYPPAFE